MVGSNRAATGGVDIDGQSIFVPNEVRSNVLISVHGD